MSSQVPNSHADRTAGVCSATLPDEIRRWNETATDYPREKTVAQVFECVAATQPEAVALTIGPEHVCYSELNRRANRIARELRRRGVAAETLVGCHFERSIEMIVAFLAVLKAGAAFVPLDPTDPPERVASLVRDADLHLVLSQERLRSRLACGGEFLSIEEIEAKGSKDDDKNLKLVSGPRSLAYVMYTSGSTGKPKGV
ncbi:MAG: AMP-binding protein, partial [Candidatus Acidiferrales bacterium]